MVFKKCFCLEFRIGVLIMACVNFVTTPIVQFFDYDPEVDADGFTPETGIRIFYVVIVYILSICLILAVYKKDRQLLLPFLYLGLMSCIASTIMIFRFASEMSQYQILADYFMPHLIIAIINTCYFWFQWGVVYCYHILLRNEAAAQENTPA